MNIFFDTSVLVAACERNHPHFPQSSQAVRRVASGKDRGFISAHSIAEAFAALTRLPVQPRVHPVEASRIIGENILPHFEVIPLSKEDYVAAIEEMAGCGWPGAKVYDALLLQCAAKCAAERIYTFNLGDFKQLAPENLRDRICTP